MTLEFTERTNTDELAEHLTSIQPTWNVTSHFLAMLLVEAKVVPPGTIISANDEGYLDFKRKERI